MRITGGEWVRRSVLGPTRDLWIRPTPDALREQAFAVLGPEIEGAAFLDLFAGTGVVSLEALSRGASKAFLCEQERRAVTLIERNMVSLGAPRERWELLVGDVRRTLARLAATALRANVVWCDPPFDTWKLGEQALATALELGVFAPGARVVIETPPKAHVAIPGFTGVRQLRGALLLRVI